ncbi:MAG: hypothetical protein NTW21_43930 [Verrucomicrobia bacterium]|nr:hypothetical protein [Verrucomicrobiota bacterium]
MKNTTRSKELRRDLAATEADIARLKALPPPPSAGVVIRAAFLRGLRGEQEPPVVKFDIPAAPPRIPDMTPARPLSFEKLASVYPCSRARLAQLSKKHGRQVLLDPSKLAEVMLRGKPQGLMQSLIHPGERARIERELSALTAKA